MNLKTDFSQRQAMSHLSDFRLSGLAGDLLLRQTSFKKLIKKELHKDPGQGQSGQGAKSGSHRRPLKFENQPGNTPF